MCVNAGAGRTVFGVDLDVAEKPEPTVMSGGILYREIYVKDMVMLNSLCQLDWVMDAQKSGYTLLWVSLGGCL